MTCVIRPAMGRDSNDVMGNLDTTFMRSFTD